MTATPTQRVVIVGPNLIDQTRGEFHVHREGCADLKRDSNLRHEDQAFVVDAATRADVCDAVYPPGDFDCESGEYVAEFHFAPCVTLHPTTTGAPR